MNADLLETVEPIITSVAAEFGRQHHVHGADADDFAQELRIWVFKNRAKVEKWLDPELFDEKAGTRLLAKTLRNEAKDYGLDIKAQATGYARSDVYFYSKGEVESLLALVFDREKWLEPPQSEGRSQKSPAEGGNWVTTLADVSRAFDKLEAADRALLVAFHRDDRTNKSMAFEYDISESLMSYRHDRALERLLRHLGGSKPQMRQQDGQDVWRGRRAVGVASSRVYQQKVYDGE